VWERVTQTQRLPLCVLSALCLLREKFFKISNHLLRDCKWPFPYEYFQMGDDEQNGKISLLLH
jgi:hypothetical protein